MSEVLPIVERFHSLQGEGLHFGRSAFFIRLGGCKVGCRWCDTKESWPINSHSQQSISEISREVAIAHSKGASFVVITGGEPLHHNLYGLCESIKKITTTKNRSPIPIHLETSGVNELSGDFNWITLSPKRHSHPKNSLLQTCDELKIIIHEHKDLDFAEQMARESINQKKKTVIGKDSNKTTRVMPYLFLQPGWNHEQGKNLAIEYIKRNPHWRLSFQVHKLLGVE